MSKFKVGDRVEVKGYGVGTVTEALRPGKLIPHDMYVYVKLDNGKESGWGESSLSLISPNPLTKKQTLTKSEYLAFIEKTFAEMTTLIKAKNSDYTAGSDDPFANFRQSVDYGVDPLSGLMVRVGDKLQRIKSFTKAGKLEVANEGVEDAFKDLIGYSLIALGMLSERKPD